MDTILSKYSRARPEASSLDDEHDDFNPALLSESLSFDLPPISQV
jgi:hypothetical protein